MRDDSGLRWAEPGGHNGSETILSNGNANDFSRFTLELLYLCSSCDMIFTFSCFQGDGILNI
jgi:hypothetical protein